MTAQPALSIKDLSLSIRSFDGVAEILSGVSLEVRRGERVAIVGESGCGKTSTANIAMGLLRGRHLNITGSVELNGVDVLRMSPREWRGIRGRRISMIFQDPGTALNPVFTVGDQMIEAILRGGTARNRAAASAVAVAALRSVQIADPQRVLASYPFQLSGGLNQRVLITMALVNEPDVVVADEPGSALDVTVQEQTLSLMTELTTRSGAAVLLITHNLGVVREFAQRVYVMYSGTIVEAAETEALFGNPRHPYTQALLAAVPRLSGDRLPEPIDGSVPSYFNLPPGCRFEPRCRFARAACSVPPPVVETAPGHRVACVIAA